MSALERIPVQLPPHNMETEAAVLGAMLMDNDVIPDVLGIVKPEDFYFEGNRIICAAMGEIWNSGSPIDLTLLANHLRERKLLDIAGGALHIASLEQYVLSSGAAPENARIVAKMAEARRLFEYCRKVVTGEIPCLNGTMASTLRDGAMIINGAQKRLAIRRELKTGRPVLPTFPVNCLPDWLARFVGQVSWANEANIDMCCLHALGVIGAALGGRVRCNVYDDWYEAIQLYLLTVLPPSDRKTKATSELMRPADDYEDDRERAHKKKARSAAKMIPFLKNKVKALQKEAAKGPQARAGTDTELEAAETQLDLAESESAPYRYFNNTNPTPESLCACMAANNGRGAIITDEAEVFNTISWRDGSANLGIYLNGHTNAKIVESRSAGDRIIKSAALTISIAAQPAMLETLGKVAGGRGRGFFARWIIACPESRIGYRESTFGRAVEDHVRETYRTQVRKMYEMPDRDDGHRYYIVKFSKEAAELMRDMDESREHRLREGADLHSLGDWAGKYTGMVARIATILHFAEHVYGEFDARDVIRKDISQECLEKAAEIGEYCIEHIKHAYSVMGADSSGAMDDARKIMGWCEKTGNTVFEPRDIQIAFRWWKADAEKMEQALSTLVANGWLEEEEVRPPKGGRPKRVFHVTGSIEETIKE